VELVYDERKRYESEIVSEGRGGGEEREKEKRGEMRMRL